MEMLNDPAYRQCCDDAVFSVFEAHQSDYAPTPERESYLLRYAAGRPLTLTLTLLQSAWAACQINEKRHERGELLTAYQRPEDSPPPSDKQIDALDDAAVENLYRASLREYARSIKAPGVSALMSIIDFAIKHKLKVRRDAGGGDIIPGRNLSQILRVRRG